MFRGTDRLYGTTQKQFTVVRCTKCGLARLSPQPEGEELSAYYPKHYWFEPDGSLAGWLEERYRRLLLRDHLRFIVQALRTSGAAGAVLDVGCGGGLLLALLRDRGFRVLGLDASEEAAGVAWKRNGVPVFVGDLAHAPLRNGTSAVVSMYHVVEHLPDPEAYLRAARELLVPNGRLIVQVPNIRSWQFHILGSRWNGADVPRHLHNFRPKDLRRLLESCGFAIVREKHFSWRDNPAGLATSLAPRLEPVARRVRGTDKTALGKLVKNAVYLALVAAAVPFTLLEAAFGFGSTIMVEARRE